MWDTPGAETLFSSEGCERSSLESDTVNRVARYWDSEVSRNLAAKTESPASGCGKGGVVEGLWLAVV